MFVPQETKSLIEEKYQKMKLAGLTEDFFNKEKFGELKVFINNKPKFSLISERIGADQVYLGSNSM